MSVCVKHGIDGNYCRKENRREKFGKKKKKSGFTTVSSVGSLETNGKTQRLRGKQKRTSAFSPPSCFQALTDADWEQTLASFSSIVFPTKIGVSHRMSYPNCSQQLLHRQPLHGQTSDQSLH